MSDISYVGILYRKDGELLYRGSSGTVTRLATISVEVRKATIGWWVDGCWCPTKAIRDHWITRRARRRS